MTLKARGVDYLFANAGTDFPPIIEALATRPETLPEPVTILHETAAVAMAHGYYLVSGKPQAMMVHVNAAMGVINAASDNIPLIMMSGRTSLTEHGRHGARGPVYLSLPREPLDEEFPEIQPLPPIVQAVAKSNSGNQEDIVRVAKLLDGAKSPLVICQRGDVAGEIPTALSKLGLPVVEPFTIRNVMASNDPCARGFTLELLNDADVILLIDSAIAWIEKHHRPIDAKIITLVPDPLFQRIPVRSFQSDISILGDAGNPRCSIV